MCLYRLTHQLKNSFLAIALLLPSIVHSQNETDYFDFGQFSTSSGSFGEAGGSVNAGGILSFQYVCGGNNGCRTSGTDPAHIMIYVSEGLASPNPSLTPNLAGDGGTGEVSPSEQLACSYMHLEPCFKDTCDIDSRKVPVWVAGTDPGTGVYCPPPTITPPPPPVTGVVDIEYAVVKEAWDIKSNDAEMLVQYSDTLSSFAWFGFSIDGLSRPTADNLSFFISIAGNFPAPTPTSGLETLGVYPLASSSHFRSISSDGIGNSYPITQENFFLVQNNNYTTLEFYVTYPDVLQNVDTLQLRLFFGEGITVCETTVHANPPGSNYMANEVNPFNNFITIRDDDASGC